MLGIINPLKKKYNAFPFAIFTDPEVARVGLTEKEAKESNIPFEVFSFSLDDIDRFLAEGVKGGQIKFLIKPKSDKLLGVTIIGPLAGELITEFVLAMNHNLGLGAIMKTVHLYPSFSEANKLAVGAWQRTKLNPSTENWMRRWSNFQRG